MQMLLIQLETYGMLLMEPKLITALLMQPYTSSTTPQNNKARTYIILHCGNQQTAWIHLLKTSKEIWDKLKATYECCNKVLKLLYLKKSMSDGQIVPKLLEDFQGALDKVAIVGLTFNDQEGILLLVTLLNSWHAIVMT